MSAVKQKTADQSPASGQSRVNYALVRAAVERFLEDSYAENPAFRKKVDAILAKTADQQKEAA